MKHSFLLIMCALAVSKGILWAQQPPLGVTEIGLTSEGYLRVGALVPEGYRHAVLEASSAPASGLWEAMVAGPLPEDGAWRLQFTLPNPGAFALVRVRVGASTEVPLAKHADERWLEVERINDPKPDPDPDPNPDPDPHPDPDPDPDNHPNPAPQTETEKIGHLLNRIAYGPSKAAFDQVQEMGIASYIDSQLTPREPAQTTLKATDYFLDAVPGEETFLIEDGSVWQYFKGREEPPNDWNALGFADIFWETGRAGIGYGDGDDRTVLDDMAGDDGYLTLYARHRFQVADLTAVENLRLRLIYDDGFVAYLNGREIARANVTGVRPRHDQMADGAGGNVDNDLPMDFVILDVDDYLVEGENVLAVQIHNAGFGSSDLSFAPSFYHAPSPSYEAIRGLPELQRLVHDQGIYSERQLQMVLADFWENHFTTDYHKVVDYLEELGPYEQLLGNDVIEDQIERQIESEAAQMEFQEYAFFRDHALGYFGDLLLYSATSPSMLIYLDNVTNLKEQPNENYAREILELYAFGVDNRYTQSDIEELARCFTGWTIRKVPLEYLKPFPEWAREPHTAPSLEVVEEIPYLDLGPGWRYFKGTREPSPDGEEAPTTAWAQPGFNDAFWESGATGIGYDDGDDATVLSDMRGNYLSVYARRQFTLEADAPLQDLVLSVRYDDGYVAYLNGEEIGRSYSMRNYGSPPPFDRESRNHEADNEPDVIRLADHQHLLRFAPEQNVLAFQVHNTTLNSSDLSLAPRIIEPRYAEGSIDPTDSAGLWTFRFNPDEHDLGEKRLFEDSPHEIVIPAGRTGQAGVNDAIQVIDAMIGHPSTREFVVIKLVNKFVSDEISVESYQERSAPTALLELVDTGIAAWQTGPRPGHIGTVMRVLLDPDNQANAFWSGIAYRSKVKSAVEYLNSAVRALDAEIINDRLRDRNEDLGMQIFEREDPDGFPEDGPGWMNTQGLLERIKYGQALTRGLARSGAAWDPQSFFQRYQLTSPEALIEHFNRYFFQGHLQEDARRVLIDFANTDDECLPSPWGFQGVAEQRRRLRDLTALLLAAPDFQFQ